VQGIVLAGVGDGNSSKAAFERLSAAAKQGIVVVRSSRVGAGFTVRNAELNDDQLGLVAAQDLNPPRPGAAAAPDRQWITDPYRIQEAFATR
jgi:L-asparaginase